MENRNIAINHEPNETYFVHGKHKSGFFALVFKKDGSFVGQRIHGMSEFHKIDRLTNPDLLKIKDRDTGDTMNDLNEFNTDVYYSQWRFLKFGNRRIENSLSTRVSFVDLDYHKIEAHKHKTPGQMADEFLIQCELLDIPLPSYIQDSGRGLYAKWLLDEDVLACDAEQWSKLQIKIAHTFDNIGGDEKCKDASRVLRVEGSINTKSGTRVKTIWVNEDILAEDAFTTHSFLDLKKAFGLTSTSSTCELAPSPILNQLSLRTPSDNQPPPSSDNSRNCWLFNRGRFWAYARIKNTTDPNIFYDEVLEYLLNLNIRSYRDIALHESEVRDIARSISTWVIKTYDPRSRFRANIQRGSMGFDPIEGLSAKEFKFEVYRRRAASGRRTSRMRRESSQEAINAAITQLSSSMTKPSIGQIASFSGRSVSTVKRHLR